MSRIAIQTLERQLESAEKNRTAARGRVNDMVAHESHFHYADGFAEGIRHALETVKAFEEKQDEFGD
jgi:hypothetical protein